MTEYALVGPGGEIKARRSDVDPGVPTKAGWRWLPVVMADVSFDQTTEVREGPVTIVGGEAITLTWTKRAKTQSELSAEKDASIEGVDKVAFQVLFNHENRVRALESKTSITPAQFKAALKGLL